MPTGRSAGGDPSFFFGCKIRNGWARVKLDVLPSVLRRVLCSFFVRLR